MGTATFGLHSDVEITGLEVPVELGPNRGDVVVVACRFRSTLRLLMDQPRPRGITNHEAALSIQWLTEKQFLQKRLALAHGHNRSLGQRTSELFVKHTDGAAAKHGPGFRAMTPCLTKPSAHQSLIAGELSVMTGHQAESTQCTVQSLQGIAGVEDFKRILQWVATPTINRGIDLNVPPGKHQKCGAELVNRDAQNPVHVQNR